MKEQAAPVSRAPTVSVIIPAHNEEAFVAGALNSVLHQRFPLERLECLVVDNASDDRTAEAARSFAAQHPDLNLAVVSEPSLGVSRAKNRGAAAARGDILLFLDADSQLTDSVVADVVEQYVAGVPAGCVRIVADSSDRLDRLFFELNELGKSLFGIRTQMPYCDRRLFLELGGFDVRIRVAEDLEFLKRVQGRINRDGKAKVAYLRSTIILTSPRRLQGGPLRLRLLAVFGRWALAFMGIARYKEY
ncbi:MAG: glycosyltransferase [Chloroflexi bacterium]|nr:glycosyltransferase [Chloroflexota bacterium]MCL5107760.1 glycosyltransferase [Chloroflexota bacterium]